MTRIFKSSPTAVMAGLLPLRHLRRACRRGGLAMTAGLAALALSAPALASGAPLPVVASFSILADMTRQIGGDRVVVRSLVAAGGDAHVYQPSPADARAVAGAGLLVINGLGFEGWLGRLIRVSGYQGPAVTASAGVTPLRDSQDAHGTDMHDTGEHGEHKHGHGHGHDRHEAGGAPAHEGHDAHDGDDHGHGHEGGVDPHAWQSLDNGRIYARNIAAALAQADPGGAAAYAEGLRRYLAALDATEAELREMAARLPETRRQVITPHNAFGYFGAAYGLTFMAPQGATSDAAASAAGAARLIRLIRQDGLPAVFTEASADSRLLQQIARETGARIGGVLYADTLSAPGGPAPTYLAMMRHNMRTIVDALTGGGEKGSGAAKD